MLERPHWFYGEFTLVAVNQVLQDQRIRILGDEAPFAVRAFLIQPDASLQVRCRRADTSFWQSDYVDAANM